MAISNVLRLALKALSYPDIDVRRTYKLDRAVKNAVTALATRFDRYNTEDIPLKIAGREILVRQYTPGVSDEAKDDDSLLLFFHGGGWVTESIDTYNRVCMNLADFTGVRVLSVEYSLAPEKPYPNGVLDCYAVTRYVYMHAADFHFDPDRLVLVGDSAGGNLAAAVSMIVRDREDFRIPRCVLLYPALNNDHTESSPYASVRENGTDYLLTAKQINTYMNMYEGKPGDRLSPYFAPLMAQSFADLPETLIITAEFDPLRDEGEAYGARLKEAGGCCTVYRMPDVLHGFISLDAHFPPVREGFLRIAEFLRETAPKKAGKENVRE